MSDKDQLDDIKNENNVERVIDSVKNNDSKIDKESFDDELDDLVNTGLSIYLDEKKSEENKPEIKKQPKYVQKFIFDELTSRKDSGEIPEILKKLDITLGNNPLDYLLCTNMLSVGVDIQRLGLMIVNGQPKNHSEYIQSTGRIGRKHPGLILTIYNSLKPRDLSHFENFRLYHSAFFKYVEPISITPFSARSRDTGLFAVCVGMIRNMVPSVDLDPAYFSRSKEDVRKAIEHIKSEFSKRVGDTDNTQKEDTLSEIDNYMEHWEKLASESTDENKLQWKKTGYETKSQLETSQYLLTSVESGDHVLEGLTTAPNSLRDAEQVHDVYFYESPFPEPDEDEPDEDEPDEDEPKSLENNDTIDESMGDKK